MTALIAPARAASFEGLIFFVYDREAVKKEADPPENAIVYFYPPSASIEDRISVCGQLIGMSHFMHGFLNARPALCKLQTEKVATVHSGKYTLALGGGLGEPDSLLIRQLETLHSIFTFYHGSLERIRMMCKSQKIFLTWMNVIWDCYLHFVRHYGDFLPGVFDPLPFLDLPKRVAATCFTKASYILQACQRRQHILGGCILYSNSILCTQFEPSITERLLLLKPNQSNHPARPVKTEHDLPFGVRILNAFLSLSENLNLYDALAESAYRQTSSSVSSGTFPDLYTTSSSSASNRYSPSRQNDASDGKHLNDNLQQVSSDISGDSGEGVRSAVREGNSTENSAKDDESVAPLNTAEGAEIRNEKQNTNEDSDIAEQKEPKSQKQSETESDTLLDAKPSSVEHTDEQDVNGDRTTEGGSERVVNEVEEQNGNENCGLAEKRAQEESKDLNGDSVTGEIEVTNSTAAFDSSSCESGLSNDVSLTMEAIDVAGLKVIECSALQCEGQRCDEEKEEIKPSISSTGSSYNESKCTTSESPGNDDTDICSLVLEDLITKVVAMVEEENSDLKNKSRESVVGFGACCQACADAQKSRDFFPGSAKPCGSKENGDKVETNESLTNGNSRSVEHDLETEAVDSPPDIQDTIPPKSDSNDSEEASCNRSPKTADVAENGLSIGVNSSKDNSLRTDLIRTPIVCDSFSIRNLNVGSEKFLEKSFACVDTDTDTEIQQSQPGRPEAQVNTSTLNANGSADAVDGLSMSASFYSVESDSEIFVANGHEGVPSSEGIEAPVDTALEEVEEKESPEWFEPPLGDIHSSSLPDLEGEEELLFEEEGGGDDVNQVEGLTHVNLYVQAHSKVVLILLAEEGLNSDSNSIKALWETSLNQLGELEFLVKQSLGDESIPAHSDEYSFLVYDSFERNMKGNLDELVYQVDHSFCETTKVLHEQFENCSTLRDVTLRSRSSTVYGKSSLGRGTYLHLKGSYKTAQGVPSPRDPIFKLERRATKVLHKEHDVNVF